MPLAVLLLLGVFDDAELRFEAEADLVASPRSSGGGTRADAVFGARVSYLSAYFVGASLSAKGGTLGASEGTKAVTVGAADVRVDALVHVRHRFDVGRGVGIMPSLLLGFDASLQRVTTTVQGNDTRLFAFIPGFGYGLSVGVDWRSLAVTVQALLVSQDTRSPAFFAGLLVGYVLRL